MAIPLGDLCWRAPLSGFRADEAALIPAQVHACRGVSICPVPRRTEPHLPARVGLRSSIDRSSGAAGGTPRLIRVAGKTRGVVRRRRGRHGIRRTCGSRLVLAAPFFAHDEIAHLGYAHAIVDGNLPRIEDPPNIPDGAVQWQIKHAANVDTPFDTVWTANHPPLFYVLAAPLVGLAEALDRADGGLAIRSNAQPHVGVGRDRVHLPTWAYRLVRAGLACLPRDSSPSCRSLSRSSDGQ